MKLSDIKLARTLESIKLNNLSEEDLSKFKDMSELRKYLSRKRKERYNRNHKQYFRDYYDKNKEKMIENSRLYRSNQKMEKSIIMKLEL